MFNWLTKHFKKKKDLYSKLGHWNKDALFATPENIQRMIDTTKPYSDKFSQKTIDNVNKLFADDELIPEGMTVCQHCYGKLPMSAIFCPNCGQTPDLELNQYLTQKGKDFVRQQTLDNYFPRPGKIHYYCDECTANFTLEVFDIENISNFKNEAHEFHKIRHASCQRHSLHFIKRTSNYVFINNNWVEVPTDLNLKVTTTVNSNPYKLCSSCQNSVHEDDIYCQQCGTMIRYPKINPKHVGGTGSNIWSGGSLW